MYLLGLLSFLEKKSFQSFCTFFNESAQVFFFPINFYEFMIYVLCMLTHFAYVQFSSVQSLSRVRLFATP